MSIQIGVLSGAGRESDCERTLIELEERGGASQAGADRTLFYSGNLANTPKVPHGWNIVSRAGPHGGGNDFRWMLGHLRPDQDALLFEDDTQPCRNAVLKMCRLPVPKGCGASSYYYGEATCAGYVPKGGRTGIYLVEADNLAKTGYVGAQALRVPAWLIARIQTGEFDPPDRAQDYWLGRVVGRLGLKMSVTCPSLVQHIGADSLCTPGADLNGGRRPSFQFPGIDFDALAPWPDYVTSGGPLETTSRVCWCNFHGTYHPGVVSICPQILEQKR